MPALLLAQLISRPIDEKTDDDWTRLLKSAGVRHVRLHDGRHTAATLLLSENVHPRVVMELPGHSQMRRRWTSTATWCRLRPGRRPIG